MCLSDDMGDGLDVLGRDVIGGIRLRGLIYGKLLVVAGSQSHTNERKWPWGHKG